MKKSLCSFWFFPGDGYSETPKNDKYLESSIILCLYGKSEPPTIEGHVGPFRISEKQAGHRKPEFWTGNQKVIAINAYFATNR